MNERKPVPRNELALPALLPSSPRGENRTLRHACSTTRSGIIRRRESIIGERESAANRPALASSGSSVPRRDCRIDPSGDARAAARLSGI